MTARPSLLTCALFVLLALPFAAHAQTPPNQDCDNPSPIKWCTTPVTVSLNPALDPVLENAGYGDAVTRAAAFQQAVADWNTALASVGATFRLQYAATATQWATDQNAALCFDSEIGPPDPLQPIYADADRGNHQSDGKQTASTGHNHNNKTDAGGVNVLGPGWLVPSAGPGVSDTTMQVVPVDGVLAITTGHTQNANPDCLEEMDIFWYTHASVAGGGGGACSRIRWDYRLAGAPNAKRFDFYSVMLHELCHLLGLGHQGDDGTGKNVMQPQIGKGERYQIGVKELKCLCMLYGPAGKDCALVTGAHPSTWGAVKTLYR